MCVGFSLSLLSMLLMSCSGSMLGDCVDFFFFLFFFFLYGFVMMRLLLRGCVDVFVSVGFVVMVLSVRVCVVGSVAVVCVVSVVKVVMLSGSLSSMIVLNGII